MEYTYRLDKRLEGGKGIRAITMDFPMGEQPPFVIFGESKCSFVTDGGHKCSFVVDDGHRYSLEITGGAGNLMESSGFAPRSNSYGSKQ